MLNIEQLTEAEAVSLIVLSLTGKYAMKSDEEYLISEATSEKSKHRFIKNRMRKLVIKIDGIKPYFNKYDELMPDHYWISRKLSHEMISMYRKNAKIRKKIDSLIG